MGCKPHTEPAQALYSKLMSIFRFDPFMESRAVGAEIDSNENWALLVRKSRYRHHLLATLLQVSIEQR